MKKSSIKKQLKKDISTVSHSSFSTIMERCESQNEYSSIECVAITPDGQKISHRQGSFAKYVIFGVLLFAILCVAIVLMMGKTEAPDTRMGGYFVIDINPSVKISYDKNGIVTEASPLNDDARVLLCDLDFTGKTTDEAVEIVFDKCVSLGYFSAERENNAVMTSAINESGARDDEMTEKVKGYFLKRFSDRKMLGVVITGVQNEQLDKVASQYGIDSQKYALILYYKELGGALNESSFAEISISELYERISQLEKEIKANDIKKAQKEIMDAEERLFKSLAFSIEDLIRELEACISRADSDTPSDEKAPPPIPGEMGKPDRVAFMLGHGKDRYEGFKGKFESYLLELKSAEQTSDCKSAVDGILAILDEIKADESDEELIALIEKTRAQIELLFEEFEKACANLSTLNSTSEEENSARLEIFKNATNGSANDVEGWQRDKEGELALDWYSYKMQWDNERKNDLKAPPSGKH